MKVGSNVVSSCIVNYDFSSDTQKYLNLKTG